MLRNQDDEVSIVHVKILCSDFFFQILYFVKILRSMH